MSLVISLVLLILLSLHPVHGMPINNGQLRDPLHGLPNEILFQMISYLSKEELDEMLEASSAANETMKTIYHYDKHYSSIGNDVNFIQLPDLVIPPPQVSMFYIHACNDTFHELESRVPRSTLERLITLHIKFCHARQDGAINRTMIDEFLALSQQYASVNNLQVHGPTGQAFQTHLYKYLRKHPKDQTTLTQVMDTKKFNVNQQYKKDGNVPSSSRWTMLHQAVFDLEYRLAKQLIGINADVSAMDSEGQTPLHIAIRHWHEDHIRPLLKGRTNVNIRNNNGQTPLFLATAFGRFDMVNALLMAEANVNLADNSGFTPLHIAARRGHENIMISLLQAGAQVNALDQYKCTPLHEAVSSSSANLVETLLLAGAKVNVQDIIKRTPLSIALRKRYTVIEALLRQYGALDDPSATSIDCCIS